MKACEENARSASLAHFRVRLARHSIYWHHQNPKLFPMLLAILGAVLVGLVLGLLGSGGSILTVPVLLYLAHMPDKLAIASRSAS